jgi:hypothetical protein
MHADSAGNPAGTTRGLSSLKAAASLRLSSMYSRIAAPALHSLHVVLDADDRIGESIEPVGRRFHAGLSMSCIRCAMPRRSRQRALLPSISNPAVIPAAIADRVQALQFVGLLQRERDRLLDARG